jgi:hypothetical protein
MSTQTSSTPLRGEVHALLKQYLDGAKPDTPDFVLLGYLIKGLAAHDAATTGKRMGTQLFDDAYKKIAARGQA